MTQSVFFPLASKSNRLPRYRRAPHFSKVKIGRPKQLILQSFTRFDYLTAPQLTRLLFSPGSLTYVQAHLKDLFHAGYLSRLFLPSTTPYGSSLAIYTLDGKGHRYLRAMGAIPAVRFRARERAQREWLFLRHTLGATDLMILGLQLAKFEPGVEIAQLATERELKRSPVYVASNQDRLGIVPDGWLDIRLKSGQTCLAFELDRGTVDRNRYQRKLRGLVQYARGPYQAAFGTNSLTIAFVATVGEQRAKALIDWTQTTLSDLRAHHQADIFRFAAFDPAKENARDVFFGARWHRPFDPAPLPLLVDHPTETWSA